MEKICVEVLLANQGRYEFLLPGGMFVRVAKELMVKVISGMEGAFLKRQDLVLYSLERECEVELNVPVSESCMKDGCRLLLI